MEEIRNTLRDDKQLIMLTHLSQLATLALGFGSLLIPLVIWLTQKENVLGMDDEGKKILNFQISLVIYCILCIPLILLCGLGFIGFIIIGLVSIILPIMNAIKVNNNEPTSYPFSFKFIN
ncbi:conserved hypothetical protein [Formosa agariphila KMM 3901]|uniref:tRNA modification GTPase n=1 Tax=Formosa agariphila (strain DSM 15362 / KCTC 12365 / LMG 23005 / KMM 3901 / M-2Alg 35-1) TaxID=1347342 RepID=T2KIH6_FORAG|nr:DUF4870 domain-containing protein [Formosa agariphila]CDF78677.1 conserved hypothetical protein [Formosa agariphila KMM 3901]